VGGGRGTLQCQGFSNPCPGPGPVVHSMHGIQACRQMQHDAYFENRFHRSTTTVYDYPRLLTPPLPH